MVKYKPIIFFYNLICNENYRRVRTMLGLGDRKTSQEKLL